MEDNEQDPGRRRRAKALAGVNSSSQSQQAGRNEHLRAFNLEYPAPAVSGNDAGADSLDENEKARIIPRSRESLFTPSTATRKETYQRVLRVASSRRKENEDVIGAAATGLAPEGEVIVFDPHRPELEKERGRINLGKGEEANDVDVTAAEEGYQVAYCTDFDVSLYKLNQHKEPIKPVSSTKSNPRFIYSTPFPDVFTAGTPRPRFRALRFLTPSLLVLLSNRPSRSGAELSILQFSDDGLGKIVHAKRLHRSLKAAVSLDVSILSRDGDAERQFVIAVAGQDISIELLTVDYSPIKGVSNFRPYTILRSVHPLQITKLVFSHFSPTTTTLGPLSGAQPVHLRLASVSMGNTVVIHNLSLSKTATDRCVLVRASPWKRSYALFFSVMLTVFLAILLQSYFELHRQNQDQDSSRSRFLVSDLLSPQVRNLLSPAWPSPWTESSLPLSTPSRLRDLVDQSKDKTKHVFIRHGDPASTENENENDSPTSTAQLDISHSAPPGEQDKAKRWDDLAEPEKEYWREKLTEAGHWVAHEGETVLKSVFFGEVAGAVGRAAAGG